MATGFQRSKVDAPISGLVLNASPERIAPQSWVTLHNFRVFNGALVKIKGWIPYGQVQGAVGLIQPVNYKSGSVDTLVGTHQNLYKMYQGNPQPLNNAPFLMNSTQRMTADYLGGKWYFTDQNDGLIALDSSGALTPVAAGVYAQFIAQFADHLLLANLATADLTGPFTLAGSSLLNPDTNAIVWDYTNLNSDALIDTFGDSATAIQAICRGVNGQLEVYKEKSIYLLNYSAAGYASSGAVVPAMGILAPYSLVDTGMARVYFGQDNIYMFNGSSNQPIGDRVWKAVMALMTKANKPGVWGFRDTRYQEIIFALPGTGKALVWNYQYDSYSTRDWPFTACGFCRTPADIAGDITFDQGQQPMDDFDTPAASPESFEDYGLLAGDAAGNLWMLDDTVSTENNQVMTATAETGDTDLGAPERMKMVEGIDLDCPIISDTPLQVYIAVRDTLADPLVWQGPYLVTARQRTVYFPTCPSGVYFRTKFVYGDGDFTLNGYSYRFRPQGVY